MSNHPAPSTAPPGAPTTAPTTAATTKPMPTDDDRVDWRAVFSPTVLVAALGYFVDLYDLLLFRIVRQPSLVALGVPADKTLEVGFALTSAQDIGLLIGGFLWGALGDRRGRTGVLYGSILLYSLANIANAFVPNVEAYLALRLIAGVGLAGELGVAITLVSEVLPPRIRGYGTTMIATVGVLGAVVASTVTTLFDWKTAYLVGGGLGIVLLALRIRMVDSALFHAGSSTTAVARGNFFALFTRPERTARYLAGVMLAVPTWYVIGMLIATGDKLAPALGVQGAVTTADTILWCYLGLSLGDLLSGVISQALASRRKVIALYYAFATAMVVVFFTATNGMSSTTFFGLCFLLGMGVGYWAMVMQMIAEMFGTNLRATATTSSANVVRATVIPMGIAMTAMTPALGHVGAVAVIGIVVLLLSLAALLWSKETFGRSLAFDEE
jgi:predicted MFS family arabinose efflux permease